MTGPHVTPEIFEGATTPLDSDISPQPGVQLTYCNGNFEAIASAYTKIRLMAAIGYARQHPGLSKAKIAVMYQINVSTYDGGFEGCRSPKKLHCKLSYFLLVGQKSERLT